ncbi:phospholipase D family protein [Nocardioides sp.]|uniref:phospholipase D family protein n=1 Tax=Nocardioides sp. TaxID=35761 RepID=UPI00352967BC
MAVSDWFLTASERGNPHTRIDQRHPDGEAWSEGNRLRALIHGRGYFAELHERIGALGPGDRLYFADWRGDPDEQLTDDPGSTLTATLTAASRRGVDVRGLLWRSHWQRLGFSSRGHRFLGEEIDEAGGECLRDMRVRTFGAHHQKFVVLRHADDPTRDIAFLGGIDLCYSRRDDEQHLGDPQPLPMAPAYGPRPAWHDVQVAIQGPAVHDVETTFRERWEDSTPLTLNPGRLLSSLLQSEQLVPGPLGEQWPPPPRTDGHDTVQILRTFPEILPHGYDFAPEGERSVMMGNLKAITQADRLVYVEDQYLWSSEVGEHFASALRANPELRVVVILPLVPDEGGPVGEPPQLYGRSLAMAPMIEAGGDRVAVFGLTNEQGMPVYVHSKTCIIDHRWASIGSDNLNRRSWTNDSEIACVAVDDRGDDDRPAPEDAFARVLLRSLVSEHLGCRPDEVPEDPVELFDAMVACADALDDWYAGARDDRHGVRGLVSPRLHLPGKARARRRASGRAGADTRDGRPPGRLRRLAPPELGEVQRRWAAQIYRRLFDPEGWVNEARAEDPPVPAPVGRE